MDAEKELKDHINYGDKDFRPYGYVRQRENEDHSRNQMSAMRKDSEDEYRIALGGRFILAAM
jgi:hypothetical protein